MTILERIQADRENFAESFERYVGNFVTQADLKTLFMYNEEEIDLACHKAFNMSFKNAYNMIKAAVCDEGKGLIIDMARGGNNVALKMFGEYMLQLNRAEDSNNAKISISIDISDSEED